MQINSSMNKYNHDMAIELQISQLHTQVRNDPARVELRIYLAQLLMICGQWDKALQQLQTATQLDSKTAAMAQTYRALIQAELYREQVFNGKVEPQYLGTIESWQTLIAEALLARAHNQTVAAEKFQQHSYDDAPTCAFMIDNASAQWVADGDSRLGPICEAFINGNYYWIAFTQIQQITLDSPKDLRDLVWIPAVITLIDFSQHFGFLPSRYAFSYTHNNDQLSLANLTEWQSLSEHSWAGAGQKILVTDDGDYPLLTIRKLTQLASK